MIIIKVGGGRSINWDHLAEYLSTIQEKFIVVHGANAWMTDISEKLGVAEIIEISEGRMKKKLLGVKEAFAAGVKSVFFGDGRIKNPLSSAIKGKGTVIN